MSGRRPINDQPMVKINLTISADDREKVRQLAGPEGVSAWLRGIIAREIKSPRRRAGG